MEFVYELNESSNLSIDIIGTKAYGLFLLLKNKIRVPPASVISTKAYSYFLDFAKNKTSLDFQWPKYLLEEVKETFLKYKSQNLLPLAVRSSGIGEDKKHASYAGQLHTELNVKDFNQLLNAILKCWKSSLSENYLEYHLHKSFDKTSPKMAIIIQQMVDPFVSGVMFTAHPVTSDLSKLIIETHKGLAQNVVDGRLNCERYIFDKISKQFSYETSILNQGNPFLSSNEAEKLFKFGITIQDIFKWPQDIEWSIVQDTDGNKFIDFLQSRPITTLYFAKNREGM